MLEGNYRLIGEMACVRRNMKRTRVYVLGINKMMDMGMYSAECNVF